MATWGGSTQGALDEDEGDEDVYLSDGLGQAEEEEERDSSSNEFPMCPSNVDERTYFSKDDKDRLVINSYHRQPLIAKLK